MEELISRLTDDLIAEILSRVPYKSLCICKCVCPAWRGIIADPANRNKMAQTLAGFFYRITADSAEPRGYAVNYADLSAFPWASVPRTHPILPLPPDSTDGFVSLEDSGDGLLPPDSTDGFASLEDSGDGLLPRDSTDGFFSLEDSCDGLLPLDSTDGFISLEDSCDGLLPPDSTDGFVSLEESCDGLLPADSTDCFFSLDDSCDGLFLTRICTGTRSSYMVSNPATSEYTLLPHSGYDADISNAYLGFDSAVSTQEFHVFELVQDWSPQDHRGIQILVVTGVRIYSSKTGAWLAMQPKWDTQVSLYFSQPRVFRKGCLHLLTDESWLAMVDVEGLRWKTVPLPILDARNFPGFIGKSAGQLFYIDLRDCSDRSLTISVYVLSVEIYNWDVSHLDGECMYWNLLHKFSVVIPNKKFLKVIGVHPHANLIFIAHSNKELLAYDLDHHESTIVYHLDQTYHSFTQFFTYVPLLSCLPLDGGIRLATPN